MTKLLGYIAPFVLSIKYGYFKHENFLKFNYSKLGVKILDEAKLGGSASPIVMVAHIYYQDFLPKFFASISAFPKNLIVFVSTSSVQIQAELIEYFLENHVLSQVRLVPNVGRNFAPLLVEFGKELLKFDHFIHVHSKKSVHSKAKVGRKWLTLQSDLLMDPKQVRRIVEIGKRHDVDLVYPDVSGLVRRINMFWGQNSRFIRENKKMARFQTMIDQSEILHFPAGGMFWARTSALRGILEVDWKYDDFPDESGQIDGTMQHAIERLIGVFVMKTGSNLAIYSREKDQFFTPICSSDSEMKRD